MNARSPPPNVSIPNARPRAPTVSSMNAPSVVPMSPSSNRSARRPVLSPINTTIAAAQGNSILPEMADTMRTPRTPFIRSAKSQDFSRSSGLSPVSTISGHGTHTLSPRGPPPAGPIPPVPTRRPPHPLPSSDDGNLSDSDSESINKETLGGLEAPIEGYLLSAGKEVRRIEKYMLYQVYYDEHDMFRKPTFLEQMPPPEKVLDVGCGYGYWLRFASWQWRFSQFTGFDIRQYTSCSMPNDQQERIKYSYGDITDLSPMDRRNLGQFNYIRVANMSIAIPWPKWKQVMQTLSSLLAPGGILEVCHAPIACHITEQATRFWTMDGICLSSRTQLRNGPSRVFWRCCGHTNR
ncbi:hypothetical protein CALCODRAFT_37692 [Calocera cornea HHB12733]|uniref:Methyltransferase domain-containing protein n=1 Tax=Calocera cornea HHB12733 TaxID=1353952 RepID=A0A165DXZ8_9BASI|nr:hypothetical protein CALCODRAFT_37692 [Calocera cornea HHB12733]